MKSSLVFALVSVGTVLSAWALPPPCDPEEFPCVPTPPFINFESAPVHPVDLSPDGRWLAVAVLPAGRVEIFDVSGLVPQASNSVAVGVDPVSVRFRTANELWVVNTISGSINIVDVALGRVRATLQTLPRPADVVFAGTPSRAFVSCAWANTIQVFDPASGVLVTNLPVDGDRPKALAVSPDGQHVYAAIFESGNASTILAPRFTTLTNTPPPNVVDFPGGPYGGQNPPPNQGNHFFPPINPNIPSTNPPPKVTHIVKKNSAGRWLDDNQADWTEFVSGTNAHLSGRPMGWDMPDRDLAIIDASSFGVTYASGLMNICMALAVNPASGRVSVVGIDGTNERRFEPNLQGTFLRVQLALVDPVSPTNRVIDLNPHLDYQTPRVPQSMRDRSLGDPRAMVWNRTGTRAYVAGMGSRNLVVLDAEGNRARPNPIEVGEGPCGLALNETRQRLYVYNRFSASLSVLDTSTGNILTNLPLVDPTPAAIKAGRRHFYDTRLNSGLGHASCASCHVDGRFDRLAWDLGNPASDLLDSLIPTVGIFHPMKGPMVTQTLQDTVNLGVFLHWRGDRGGIESFNVTFTDLLGRDTLLTTNEMEELKGFLTPFHFPPNPNRNFDNTLSTNVGLAGLHLVGTNGVGGPPLVSGNALRGRTLSHDCRQCHPAFRGGGSFQFPDHIARSGTMPFKAAQLRSLPEKFGFDLSRTNSRAGFGFTHDGRVDTLTRFLADGFPELTDNRDRADLIAWMLSFAGSGEISDQDDDGKSFSLDVPAAVGRQITITSSHSPLLLSQMIEQAERTEQAVDLVVAGTQAGINRGWHYERATRRFQSDRQTEDLSLAELLALATAETPLTFTVVTRGAGQRLGADRDGDGYFDRTEIEAGYNPSDPNSHGETVARRFYGRPEEGLSGFGYGPLIVVHPEETTVGSLAAWGVGREWTYTLGGDIPPNASIDATSGEFTWISAQPGTWRFFVRATETTWPHFNDVAELRATAVSLRLRFEFTEPGDTLLAFDGVPNRSYRVERKRQLTDADWESLGQLTPSSGRLGFQLTGDKAGFYRVVAQP